MINDHSLNHNLLSLMKSFAITVKKATNSNLTMCYSNFKFIFLSLSLGYPGYHVCKIESPATPLEGNVTLLPSC